MIRISLLIIGIAFISCNNPISDPGKPGDKTNEKLISPEKKSALELPEDLSEISGITFLNDSVLVAIQDEDGILFFYNIKQNRILRKQWFADEDDYEDLAKAGKDMYVVTSKGLLYQIKNFESANPQIRSFKTPFGAKHNIEGLAYDPGTNSLLIAPKEDGLDNDETTKEIYRFDLKTMKLQSKPAFTILLDEIESHFEGDALQESSKKFLKALGNRNMNRVFKASALAVKEKTGEVYALSAINEIILILDKSGELKKIIQFSGPEFKQPEGIAFSPGGKLYISNEGNKSGIGNIIELIHEN